MQFHDAKVADIVRCSQKDELFVTTLQEDIFSLLKIFGARNYTRLRKTVPVIANVWYYYLTSLENLQTLGEEYTGTLRFTEENKIPSKLVQILWLALYVGGESLYDRLFDSIQNKLESSSTLVPNAKNDLLKFIAFMKTNKILLLRLHHSLFYINGTYYNISNHITGVKYVLLRKWLQDDSSTFSFKILGKISLLYLLYFLIHQGISSAREYNVSNSVLEKMGRKMCSLCAENRKNASATPCGHIFCWDCIYDSLNYQQKCPICREVINPSRIIFLQNYV